MSDVAGSMFGKMLKMQADKREQHKWMASLRGGKKAEEAIGLKEFHLKYNKLNDQGAISFAKFLETDEYLRVLDLSYNFFSPEIIL